MKKPMDLFRHKFVEFVDEKIIPYYTYCGGRMHGWSYVNSIDDKKKDKENKFMLIQKDHINAGVMEDYINFLLAIDFALSRGLIPVIDRITYPAKFQQEEEEWGKRNSWEIYFEQPFKNYDVEYVKMNAQNTIEATPFITFDILEVQSCDGERFMRMFLSNKAENIMYAEHLKEVASKYIRFNKRTWSSIIMMQNKVFEKKEGKVLAVSVREEMYLRNEPTGVKLDNLLEIVKNKMELFNCSQIFIASEFQCRIQEFIDYFGEKTVLFLERKRPYSGDDKIEKKILELSENYTDSNCKQIFKLQEEVFGPKYNRWLNYLAEMYCISCCESAILQVSSGNTGALIMKKERYENVVVLNNLKEFSTN